MAELRLPEPSEKQKQFLRDRHRYIGYGGARGGGKSWAVRVKAVLLCLRYPGIKVMIVRRTYPELRENHILPLCRMLGCYGPEDERIAVYHEGQKTLAFPNGSRILFRYLESEGDTLRFQGSEVDVLFVDEATQQSEEKMESLRACVRGVNDFPKRMYFTCNPGGEGHGWVKRLFIDRRFREGEEPEEHHGKREEPQRALLLRARRFQELAAVHGAEHRQLDGLGRFRRAVDRRRQLFGLPHVLQGEPHPPRHSLRRRRARRQRDRVPRRAGGQRGQPAGGQRDAVLQEQERRVRLSGRLPAEHQRAARRRAVLTRRSRNGGGALLSVHARRGRSLEPLCLRHPARTVDARGRAARGN